MGGLDRSLGTDRRARTRFVQDCTDPEGSTFSRQSPSRGGSHGGAPLSASGTITPRRPPRRGRGSPTVPPAQGCTASASSTAWRVPPATGSHSGHSASMPPAVSATVSRSHRLRKNGRGGRRPSSCRDSSRSRTYCAMMSLRRCTRAMRQHSVRPMPPASRRMASRATPHSMRSRAFAILAVSRSTRDVGHSPLRSRRCDEMVPMCFRWGVVTNRIR